MKIERWKHWRGMGAILLAAVALGSPFMMAWTHAEAVQSGAAGAAAPARQALSAEGQGSLAAIAQAGNLPGMRWPNFSDYAAHVQKFYGMYRGTLPWVSGMQPTAQAQEMIGVLEHSDQKGLTPDDYDAALWDARLAKFKPGASPSEADAIQLDAALTVCAMRYISDLHIGKVNPKHFDYGLNVDTKKYDLPEFLNQNVVDSANVPAALIHIEPPYPGYQRTIEALQNYIQLAKADDGAQLPALTKPVAPGDMWAGVPRMTRLLTTVGDLPKDASVPADSTVYQGPLVDAVKHFQARHGRTVDGKLTTQTVADMNVPIAARIREMQLTLERWRWLPVADPAAPHMPPLLANIPEFRLRAYDEKFNIVFTMNVQVGEAYDHDTPVFSDTMEYVVFRPYWSVPYSIARAELLPRIEKDPNYLAAKGFEVVDSRQNVVTSGAVSSDQLAQLRSGRLFIRQNPGPTNSLGLVKFIFPNSYNIYMHDTPDRQFFSRTRRDDSHGCIRLERPADLAVWVLRNNPGWDKDRVNATMNGKVSNLQVNLTQPVPVLIVYGTVVVTEDQQVHFYDDIYGHDKTLEAVLDKGYPYPNQ
jgi:L,D-transpeptidase YcbB